MVSSEQIAKISKTTWNNNNDNSNSSSSSNRRRKMEIKRVEESSKRHVTFSKRKQGLFNKVTELSILCEAETALIVKSQNGKLYSCGYPTPDTVIRRFLNNNNNNNEEEEASSKQKECVETLRIRYEATQEILKQEKQRRDENKASVMMGFPCWWDYSIDDMAFDELQQFKASLEQLKINLMATMEDKRVNSIQLFQPMPFHSMLNNNKYSVFSPILSTTTTTAKQEQQQAWNLRNNNGIVSSSNNNTSLGNDAIAHSSSSSHSYFHPNVHFAHYYHN